MAYVYIDSVSANGLSVVINATMITETAKFSQQFTFPAATSMEQIKATIKTALGNFGKLEVALSNLKPGQELDLTPASTVPPTPEELARYDFSADLDTLKQIQRGIALGVISSGEDSKLLDSIKSRYIASYLDLF